MIVRRWQKLIKLEEVGSSNIGFHRQDDLFVRWLIKLCVAYSNIASSLLLSQHISMLPNFHCAIVFCSNQVFELQSFLQLSL